MKKQLKNVLEFHKKFQIFYKSYPTTKVPKDIQNLRIKLMQEELEEVVRALKEEDLENIAKELSDLVYVVLGTVQAYGLAEKFEEVFDEVHKSNMSKLDQDGKPIYRKDGKVLKSANYLAPDIKKILTK